VTSSATNTEIAALDRVEIRLEPRSWPFAIERRADIERHFSRLQRERPDVWNGRILLLSRYAIEGAALRGTCFEADYSSFCAWREWMFLDPAVYNIFAAAVLQTADGACLVGEMAPSTLNGGMLYFPCGTPEPADIDGGGMLDFDANLGRELLEETGIDIGELNAEPGWTMVRDRHYVGVLKRLTARESADELRSRIMRHIAREERPELIDIRIVRSANDFDPAMPPFVTAFLAHFWS
jgi:hypothetical protein